MSATQFSLEDMAAIISNGTTEPKVQAIPTIAELAANAEILAVSKQYQDGTLTLEEAIEFITLLVNDLTFGDANISDIVKQVMQFTQPVSEEIPVAQVVSSKYDVGVQRANQEFKAGRITQAQLDVLLLNASAQRDQDEFAAFKAAKAAVDSSNAAQQSNNRNIDAIQARANGTTVTKDDLSAGQSPAQRTKTVMSGKPVSKSCPISSRKQYLKDTAIQSISIGKGKDAVEFSSPAREFSSGSMGFYFSGKVTIDGITYQLGCNLTAVGSKDVPQGS